MRDSPDHDKGDDGQHAQRDIAVGIRSRNRLDHHATGRRGRLGQARRDGLIRQDRRALRFRAGFEATLDVAQRARASTVHGMSFPAIPIVVVRARLV